LEEIHGRFVKLRGVDAVEDDPGGSERKGFGRGFDEGSHMSMATASMPANWPGVRDA
jgi:hypothetical protein